MYSNCSFPRVIYCRIFTCDFFLFYYTSSLILQASRECQSKEKLLEQGSRAAFREFQQWLVNAKINTAKCFDVPQNINEASSSLLKIQVEHINVKVNGTFRYLCTQNYKVVYFKECYHCFFFFILLPKI